jgi:hypothetical protein
MEYETIGKKKFYRCNDNYIELYDGSTSIHEKKFLFCQSQRNIVYKSKTNKIFIRYVRNKHKNKNKLNNNDNNDDDDEDDATDMSSLTSLSSPSSFRNNKLMSFKLYYNNFITGPCKNDTYSCSDNVCISRMLICNGQQNCIGAEDENNCVIHTTTRRIGQSNKNLY